MAQRKMSIRWKYAVMAPNAVPSITALTEELNKLGQDGWELAGAALGVLIFKRKVSE